MGRWILAMAFLLAALPAQAATEEATEVEVAQLVTDAETWDGERVAITGELVGDYSSRPEGVWVQLNDDPFVRSPVGQGGIPDTTNVGVGARIPTDLFARVEGPPGRYGRHGPVVRLEGVFLHSDPTLQGETYLDVDAVTTLAPAEDYPVPGPDGWLAVGALLLGLAGTMAWRHRRSGPES